MSNTITLNLPLTAVEIAILAPHVQASVDGAAAALKPVVEAVAPVSKAKASAPKAAPAPATPAPETPAEPPATTITEPADEDDVLGDDGPTRESVVAQAQALVAAGRTPDVRAALEVIGVKRVAHITDEHVAAFAAELAKLDEV